MVLVNEHCGPSGKQAVSMAVQADEELLEDVLPLTEAHWHFGTFLPHRVSPLAASPKPLPPSFLRFCTPSTTTPHTAESLSLSCRSSSLAESPLLLQMFKLPIECKPPHHRPYDLHINTMLYPRHDDLDLMRAMLLVRPPQLIAPSVL